VFTGYRWYDTRDIEPHFPFGYGLSYTTFEYSELQLSADSIRQGETLEVNVTVTNTGDRAGKEIVQLYVHEHESRFPRAVRELKDFTKVEIGAGESRVVTLRVAVDDLAQWDTAVNGWVVNTGAFDVLVGSSSRDLRLQATVQVESTSLPKKVYTRQSTMGELMTIPAISELVRANMPSNFNDATGADMLMNFMYHTPVNKLVIMGTVSEEQLQGLLMLANSQA
jgi:beta-glucosidase